MRDKIRSIGLTVTCAILAVIVLATSACAVTEKVLHHFRVKDGALPRSVLIFDAAGNLYGTTEDGGYYGLGVAFELTPTAGGGWKEKILHSFGYTHKQGCYPTSGLIFDAFGNLYGTASECGVFGHGAVFELTPTAGGWTERVLHSFDGEDGDAADAGLVFDGVGNLYGTTAAGGAYGYGTVFELTPTTGGKWVEKILHNFDNDGTDGYGPPYGALIFDTAGNLYGTTYEGGAYGNGTVFELTPGAGGSWTEEILHNFAGGSDGAKPLAGLVIDATSNLYGTTLGGTLGLGTVFELTPTVGGGWTQKILYEFGHRKDDGQGPFAGLIIDAAGNLFGTTVYGGSQGFGTVFELTPHSGRVWTVKILHSFRNNFWDGAFPEAGLIFDAAGDLYGTTNGGNYGTVFEVTP